MKKTIYFLIIFSSFFASAKEDKIIEIKKNPREKIVEHRGFFGVEKANITCINGDETRSIRVLENKKEKKCNVLYTKFFATKAYKKDKLDKCPVTKNRIKRNLEKAGYSCS